MITHVNMITHVVIKHTRILVEYIPTRIRNTRSFNSLGCENDGGIFSGGGVLGGGVVFNFVSERADFNRGRSRWSPTHVVKTTINMITHVVISDPKVSHMIIPVVINMSIFGSDQPLYSMDIQRPRSDDRLRLTSVGHKRP